MRAQGLAEFLVVVSNVYLLCRNTSACVADWHLER